MTVWFVAAVAVLIIELLTGTVYLLVVSAALAGSGIAYGLTGSTPAAVLTAALLSALGIWFVHAKTAVGKVETDSYQDWMPGNMPKSSGTQAATVTKFFIAVRTGRRKIRGRMCLNRERAP